MTKKRVDRSSTSSAESPESPFAKLEKLRAELPAGEARAPPLDAAGTQERQGKVVVRLERKGRGGKTVTVVEGLAAGELEGIARELKRALGCGAAVEGGVLVLQGEQDRRVRPLLEGLGFARVVLGSRR